jgi:DNA-binding NarL/FixJ family response regulator
MEMEKHAQASARQEAIRLKDSENRYRRLFETAQDGVLILDADTGRIDDVNPFLMKMLGYSREEFLGKRLWEIGPFKYVAASNDELAQAIRVAHAGCATLSPEATQALVHAANQPPEPGHDLTERERAVLALLVEGLNNTQIAGRLVVSPSTIKSHVSNILAKLGVASRSEAVALAVRNKLVA